MRHLTRRLSAALRSYAAVVRPRRQNLSTSTLHINWQLSRGCLLDSPWSATQFRGARFSGGDVKPGNVIERKGKIYEVIKAQHSTQGRGGAIIQVELRDIDSGNKVNERLRTDESIEKIYVQEKSFEYLYTDDGDTGNVFLMDPKTYDQVEVPPHLFGESLVFLQDGMEVAVQLYDDRPLSASIPNKAICTVVEAAESLKGSGPTPSRLILQPEIRSLSVQRTSLMLAGLELILFKEELPPLSCDPVETSC